MGCESGRAAAGRRPFCFACSKPARLCLCSRFRSPPLDNAVPITILQHALEKDHPVNSTRVAKLGLKNLTVAPVTDINFCSCFFIKPLDTLELVEGSNYGGCGVRRDDSCFDCGKDIDVGKSEAVNVSNCDTTRNVDSIKGHVVDDDRSEIKNVSNFDLYFDCIKEHQVNNKDGLENVLNCDSVENEIGQDSLLQDCYETQLSFLPVPMTLGYKCLKPCGVDIDDRTREEKGKHSYDYPSNDRVHGPLLDSFSKMTLISLSELEAMDYNCSKDCGVDIDGRILEEMKRCKVAYTSDGGVKLFFEHNAKPDIKWLKDTVTGKRVISDGFFVRKLQRKQVRVTKEFEDFEEFNIQVPPGTALLFPSENAISLKEVDFEVKHLVVLDGTWSKAKRMYHENPWLQLLPHLKLDSGKVSLYSGVRTQPKEGYLSTIESIVCALEALGEDREKLEELLDVFYSMIVDQKQCKAESFKAISMN